MFTTSNLSTPDVSDHRAAGQTAVMDEELLHGGVANADAVVRSGPHVLRPSNRFSIAVHRFLSALPGAGFDGASVPVGIDSDGRERLQFIVGDVAIPPYPPWAQSDTALASIAGLLRRFHDASLRFDPSGTDWCPDLADPNGGTVVCHNDVCLENVVFRDGRAVALIDFDFAAPGRPLFDLTTFARMCVPVDDEVSASRLGWGELDRVTRLRLIADTYGLTTDERGDLIRLLDQTIERGGEFVRRRAEAGDPGFVKMWAEMGGQERFDRRRRWWSDHRIDFEQALVAAT